MRLQLVKMLHAINKIAKESGWEKRMYWYNQKDAIMGILLSNGVLKFEGYHYFSNSKIYMRYYTFGDYGFHDGIHLSNCDQDMILSTIDGLIPSDGAYWEPHEKLWNKLQGVIKIFKDRYMQINIVEGTYEWVYPNKSLERVLKNN
jgi:hypothetical protein